MKTKHNTIARITTAAIAMIASAVTAHATNRTLILLQENNSGSSYLEGILPDGQVRDAVDDIIDAAVEGSESEKFRHLATDVPFGQSSAPYQKFINLSDADCTRAKLLDNLIVESRAGRVTDLVVLGHGADEVLKLNGAEELLGTGIRTEKFSDGSELTYFQTGNTRSLLTEARQREGASFNFKLRLVYMCNCFGSTLNDDWLAIGAKTSVGSLHNDYMPEPMIANFWNDFVLNDKRAIQAASDAFSAASVLYSVVPTYLDVDPETSLNKIQDSRLRVVGNGNLIFRDECQMALNQTKNVIVMANKTHTFPIYFMPNQTYTFSAATNDMWTNVFGAVNTNADGNTPSFLDAGRRFGGANMMALCGERFTHPNSNPFNFIGGSGFKIGTSGSVATTGYSFLNLFANDSITSYGDNGGFINVTIKRTR